MRIAVFCGSSSGGDPAFAAAAGALARAVARGAHGVVYGGASVGLMGVVADAALDAGAEVHGVIPASMVDRELAHPALTRLDVVDGMHARKARMTDLADAAVALPGGLGTLEELFEVWTWRQLGLHALPLGLLDVGHFWAPLLAQLDAMVSAGFVPPASRGWLLDDDDAQRLVERLERAVA